MAEDVIDTRPDGLTVAEVLRGLVRHPIQRIVYRWNWKSALLSSLVRSALFFAANLSAGTAAARSTSFNLFAMRRGALIVGAGSDSIWTDLRRSPGLVVAFIAAACGSVSRLMRHGLRTCLHAR